MEVYRGDSPLDPVTHAPLWAEPGFDDSKWETVDLTPNEGSMDPNSGFTRFVPGWTAKDHPGYWGYAWYRIQVHLQQPPGVRLALAGPADVDDVYQVFDNGGSVGSFGDFTGSTPVVYYSQPVMFPLSQPGGAKPNSFEDSLFLEEIIEGRSNVLVALLHCVNHSSTGSRPVAER